VSESAFILTETRLRTGASHWHPLWHWLLLLTPAAALIVSYLLVRYVGLTFFPDDPQAGRTDARGERPIDLAGQCYVIAQPVQCVLLCFALGSWWRWKGSDWGERIAFGFFIGIVIVVMNVTVLWFVAWEGLR
jgi:hypothetical protein